MFDLIRDQACLSKLCGVTVENGRITVPCMQCYEDKVGQLYYGEVKETLQKLREESGENYSALAAAIGEVLGEESTTGEKEQLLEVTGFTTIVTMHA